MVFCRVATPPIIMIPPPLPSVPLRPAVLPATVTLASTSVPPLLTPPPNVLALLPLIVLLITTAEPWFSIPPPLVSEVLLVMLDSRIRIEPVLCTYTPPLALPSMRLSTTVAPEPMRTHNARSAPAGTAVIRTETRVR